MVARSAVDKATALDVLEVVGRSDAPLRLSEIATLVELHRATAYRVLQELVRRGWIMRTGDHYLPGTAVLQMSAAAARRSLAATCRPVLAELSAATDLMVNLQVLEGCMSRVVDVVCPPRLTMINRLEGELLPAHRFARTARAARRAGAGGPPPVPRPGRGRGAPDVNGPDGLPADVTRVQHQGYALERGRHDALVASMSRAVASERGAPICALTLAGPVRDFDDALLPAIDERLAAAVARVRALLTDPPGDGDLMDPTVTHETARWSRRAADLDAADPLAAVRDEFLLDAAPGIHSYLDGNSLGRPLEKATVDAAGRVRARASGAAG